MTKIIISKPTPQFEQAIKKEISLTVTDETYVTLLNYLTKNIKRIQIECEG